MPAPPWTAHQIRDLIATRQLSAVEVCQTYLDRIAATDSSLHAFLTVTGERALARAAEIDRTPATLADRPLNGIPIALKDNLSTRGVRTTAGSRILAEYNPPYDATVVRRLGAAGAVILGKTNCDEFAMGSSTENSAFGPTRNPWALDRAPGGSSGGSAVAVAARQAPVSLGSDTGGSVRQPASLCGTLGMKPTYGRVSRYGLIAFASSLDQIGPFTQTAADMALVLNVISGPDPNDSTAAAKPVPDFTRALTGDIRGMRLGVPRALLGEGVDAEVTKGFDAALDVLRGRGAELVDVEFPHAALAIPTYYLVATAEASSNLARYDGVRYGFRSAEPGGTLKSMYERTRDLGFGAEVKRRIMLGTYVLSAGYYDAYYRKAQQVRTLIRRDYEAAFEKVDAIAMPTSPTPAFLLGERTDDPLQMYLGDVFTVSAPLAGLPALSMPCGFTTTKLPIGLQLTGRLFDEATLLRIAGAYEQDTEWWKATPTL